MNIEVKIPSAGESITSGVLSIWHKKNGERIVRDELLFTLETDKVSQEVTAADSGILHTKVAEGEEVKIGQVVAEIEPEAAGAPAKPDPTPKQEAAPALALETPKAAALVPTPPPGGVSAFLFFSDPPPPPHLRRCPHRQIRVRHARN